MARSNKQVAEKLTFLQDLMINEKNTFKPGDLVTWKHPKLADRTAPLIGEPAIILEVLETPIKPIDNPYNDDSSHYTWATLDVIVGIIPDSSDGDDAIRHFGADSRRLKHWDA